VLGTEHPSTLMSMNNLAMVLRNQGKYEQAEEMLRQALRLSATETGKVLLDSLHYEAKLTIGWCRGGIETESCLLNMLAFTKTLAFPSSVSQDVSLVPILSRKPGYEHVPFVPSPLSVQPTRTRPKRALILDARPPWPFIDDLHCCEVRMSAIAGVPSPGSGKLKADVIDGARVCLKKVNVWAQGRSFFKDDVRGMVVAGREAGIVEFWMFTLG
jgi:hypothetical protein